MAERYSLYRKRGKQSNITKSVILCSFVVSVKPRNIYHLIVEVITHLCRKLPEVQAFLIQHVFMVGFVK